MEYRDIRKRRTRRRLTNALILLVAESGYDKLTVRAITTRANLAYATFFRHFRSLDAMLEHIFNETFEELSQLMAQQSTPYEEAVALYRHCRQYQELYRLFTRLPHGHAVRRLGAAFAKKTITERYQAQHSGDLPEDLSVQHMVESIYRMVHWYLDNLHKYTPEVVAALHITLVVEPPTAAVELPSKRAFQQSPV